jgi:predicted TPR repeat methyltransferase
MPIGCYSLVPEIANRLCQRQPQRILDVGIGFGMYGAVVRQWLDLGVTPWHRFLVGVEAWGQYRNPAWDLYNLVVVDSIQGYLAKRQECFDCILMMDVLEHFEKPEGSLVLRQLQSIVSPGGMLLVGTPAVFVEQGAVHGNEFERHRSLWTPAELADLGFQVLRDGTPDRFGMQTLLAEMLLAEWSTA